LLPIPFPFSPNNEDTKPLLEEEEQHGAQNKAPPPLKTPSPPKTLLKAVVFVVVILAAFAHFDTIIIIPRRLHIVSLLSFMTDKRKKGKSREGQNFFYLGVQP